MASAVPGKRLLLPFEGVRGPSKALLQYHYTTINAFGSERRQVVMAETSYQRIRLAELERLALTDDKGLPLVHSAPCLPATRARRRAVAYGFTAFEMLPEAQRYYWQTAADDEEIIIPEVR